jgi:hypothetical protein
MPTSPQPEPTPAEIEAAWRGKPVEQFPEPGLRGAPRPAPTELGRSINRALLILMACLYSAALVALVAQAPAELTFVALGSANLVAALVALRTWRVLGIAFRGRFIARREYELGLYWASIALLGVSGAFLLFVGASAGL